MKALYLTGKAGSGKTAIALGLALALKDEGMKIAYFKPLGLRKGLGKKDDDDIILMKSLLELPYPPEVICPVHISPYYLSTGIPFRKEHMLVTIKKAYEQYSRDYDLLLLDGSINSFTATSQQINDYTLAKEFEAALINIVQVKDDFSLDEALFYNQYARLCGLNVLGLIFNNTERTLREKIKTVYRPIIERQDYTVLGVVPDRPEIASPTVAAFYEVLGGELLTGERNMDRRVEDVVVGTMTIEGALKYLRRSPNKAVITGGDRNDLALTALETSTSVIILTGGLYPDVKLIAKAREKGVPILLVHYDTYTTIESLHSIYRSIRPEDSKAITIIKENVCQYCDCLAIIDYVKAKKNTPAGRKREEKKGNGKTD